MRDDPSVITLVTCAAGNDRQAWDELVERYAPLVWTTCSRYQLGKHDIGDVGQSVAAPVAGNGRGSRQLSLHSAEQVLS